MNKWIPALLILALAIIGTGFLGYTRINKVTVTLTSDGSGDATVTTSSRYDGKLLWVATDPVDSPTDNWDLVTTDTTDLDVLMGNGANRDTANTEYINYASLGTVSDSVLGVTGSNMGTTKTATVYIFIGRR
jgi:hypothetical protein